MDEMVVVIGGEITTEYDGGLYQLIDGLERTHKLPIASRDAVAGSIIADENGVFDIIAYYDHAVDFVTQAQWWFDAVLRLQQLPGIINVSLTTELNKDEDES